MIKRVSKTTKIVLLVLLILFFGAVVVFGEDKIGQGDVVDLTDSKPKEGVVFAVCIFAVGEDGTKYLVPSSPTAKIQTAKTTPSLGLESVRSTTSPWPTLSSPNTTTAPKNNINNINRTILVVLLTLLII